jgi:2-polyprenyl-3-methyl-5-hydroxy-6-metoxy-1,4-benzoquinol methylase
MVAEEDIGRLYESYYTHAQPPSIHSAARSLYRSAQRGYIANRYGYPAPGWRERLLGFLVALHPGRRADADFLAQYLPAASTGTLLDVGCGHGATLADMHQLGWAVQGVDPDGQAVAAARARGFRVILGTVFSEELTGQAFTAITMSQVIEHVYRPIEMLRRCRALLAPGGTLVVTTPNAESRGHRLFGKDWRGLEPPRHLQVFSRQALQSAARQAGFDRVDVRATIRAARGSYDASLAIRHAARLGTGHADIPAPTARSEVWQLEEWAQSFVRPDAGEELLMLASVLGPSVHLP